MLGALENGLLRVLRVPPEPDPPAGHAGSLKTFRAAPNYFRYKLALWGLGQLVSLVVLGFLLVGLVVAITARPADGLGGCLLGGLLGVGIVVVLGQILISLVAVRLDYRMRWYLVTDQSLRIREGIFHVREMTMTFANIQNISISQGPLQRLLGVADLKVKSAGGGSGQQPHQAQAFSMHTGYFRGVDNAEELRDLMRDRMRRARDTGLGDPDDLGEAEAAPTGTPGRAEAVDDLLAAARELRRAAAEG